MSGMYLEVRGPSTEPTKIPTSSAPIRGQKMGVLETNMKVKMEVIMLMSTARAEVPATRYMGRPATLVRKGTSRKPPPTPRKEAIPAMKKPPMRGMIGLKENSTPKKVNTHLLGAKEITFTPMAEVSTLEPLLMEASNALAASLAFFLDSCPLGVVSQNR